MGHTEFQHKLPFIIEKTDYLLNVHFVPESLDLILFNVNNRKTRWWLSSKKLLQWEALKKIGFEVDRIKFNNIKKTFNKQ